MNTLPTDHPARSGALSIRGVTRRFGSVVAVDDLSLDLPAGSFFSLLGPSGCGKTTLLRIVAGLEQPDAGTLIADGVDITQNPPERRPFNTVFQRYALFPHLSVADNIALGLTTDHSKRLPKAERDRQVGAMLEMIGLGGFEHRWPAQLSGGQAQRVAVARALIRRPKVLLLDEPMAALDRNVRHQVREELLRIHSELGTTFLLVAHDQDEALSVSGLVGLMNHGRLEQVATPETLYRRPATLFAARFVGAGSLLHAAIITTNGTNAQVDVAGIRFEAAESGVRAGAPAMVLLRPEDLSVTDANDGRITGQVLTSAFFGSYFELTVRTSVGLIRLRDRQPVDPGTQIGIAWRDVAGIAYPAPANDVEAIVDVPDARAPDR